MGRYKIYLTDVQNEEGGEGHFITMSNRNMLLSLNVFPYQLYQQFEVLFSKVTKTLRNNTHKRNDIFLDEWILNLKLYPSN